MSAPSGCACCDPAGNDPAAYAETADWPADVSRILYERLGRLGYSGRTVLEIGCGYGRLLVGALVAGAQFGTGVELDDQALDDARERAEEAGVGDRGSFLSGDGAELELEPHDFVVLDRVICCYADADLLLERSLAVAERAFAMTVPETRGLRGAWNRVTHTIGGLMDRVRGEEPVYLHSIRRLERGLASAGFTLDHAEHIGKWHLGIYLRPTP